MKVVIARKELKCTFCPMPINKGDFCVRTSFKDKLNPNRWVFTFFHEECCCQQTYKNIRSFIDNQKSILRAKQAEKQKLKKKIGRPRKYSDPMKARSLKQQLTNQKKAGNIDRVGEIETEIKRLEQ